MDQGEEYGNNWDFDEDDLDLDDDGDTSVFQQENSVQHHGHLPDMEPTYYDIGVSNEIITCKAAMDPNEESEQKNWDFDDEEDLYSDDGSSVVKQVNILTHGQWSDTTPTYNMNIGLSDEISLKAMGEGVDYEANWDFDEDKLRLNDGGIPVFKQGNSIRHYGHLSDVTPTHNNSNNNVGVSNEITNQVKDKNDDYEENWDFDEDDLDLDDEGIPGKQENSIPHGHVDTTPTYYNNGEESNEITDKVMNQDGEVYEIMYEDDLHLDDEGIPWKQENSSISHYGHLSDTTTIHNSYYISVSNEVTYKVMDDDEENKCIDDLLLDDGEIALKQENRLSETTSALNNITGVSNEISHSVNDQHNINESNWDFDEEELHLDDGDIPVKPENFSDTTHSHNTNNIGVSNEVTSEVIDQGEYYEENWDIDEEDELLDDGGIPVIREKYILTHGHLSDTTPTHYNYIDKVNNQDEGYANKYEDDSHLDDEGIPVNQKNGMPHCDLSGTTPTHNSNNNITVWNEVTDKVMDQDKDYENKYEVDVHLDDEGISGKQEISISQDYKNKYENNLQLDDGNTFVKQENSISDCDLSDTTPTYNNNIGVSNEITDKVVDQEKDYENKYSDDLYLDDGGIPVNQDSSNSSCRLSDTTPTHNNNIGVSNGIPYKIMDQDEDYEENWDFEEDELHLDDGDIPVNQEKSISRCNLSDATPTCNNNIGVSDEITDKVIDQDEDYDNKWDVNDDELRVDDVGIPVFHQENIPTHGHLSDTTHLHNYNNIGVSNEVTCEVIDQGEDYEENWNFDEDDLHLDDGGIPAIQENIPTHGHLSDTKHLHHYNNIGVSNEVTCEVIDQGEDYKENWDFDEDDLHLDDVGIHVTQENIPTHGHLSDTTPTHNKNIGVSDEITVNVMDQGEDYEENWDFDEDDWHLDDAGTLAKQVNIIPKCHLSDTPTHKKDEGVSKNKVEHDLLSYVDFLSDPSTLLKANVIFKGLGTRDKALQLCQYYFARPHLKSYTINTELPRMNYTILLDNDTILTSKEEIEDWFSLSLSPLLAHDNPSTKEDFLLYDMLIRCSNQSLLVDILEVLTTDDENQKDKVALIRKRFSVSMVATKCRFVIDLRHPTLFEGYRNFKRNVAVDCTFDITIPYQDHVKLDLATLRCHIDFSPEPWSPSISYTIISIHTLMNTQLPRDKEKLHVAARHLANNFHTLDEFNHSEISYNDHKDDTIIRDNFLQSVTTSTHRGISSALREIDHVTNVSRKFNYLKSMAVSLPALAASALDTYDDNIESNIPERKTLYPKQDKDTTIKKQQHPTTSLLDSDDDDNDGVEQSRPKPVLGSLILSGLKTLAKATVTVTDTSSQPLWEPVQEEQVIGSTMVKAPTITVSKNNHINCNRDISISSSIESSLSLKHGMMKNEDETNVNVHKTCIMNTPCDEEIKLNDGWQEEDFLLEDEEEQSNKESEQDIAVLFPDDRRYSSSSKYNVFSKVRETMNRQETKQFWMEALQILAQDPSPEDYVMVDEASRKDHLDITTMPKRKRYITRAERLGLNVTF